jgi:hypothetical protein
LHSSAELQNSSGRTTNVLPAETAIGDRSFAAARGIRDQELMIAIGVAGCAACHASSNVGVSVAGQSLFEQVGLRPENISEYPGSDTVLGLLAAIGAASSPSRTPSVTAR